jgi:hypothetical protein
MRWRELVADERGYSLIELLMATLAGLVVAAATMMIVVSSYQLVHNDADRVDADQQGRIAMEQIEQLLGSSCVAGVDVSPILGGSSAGTGAPPSGANSITFYESLTDSADVTPRVDEAVIFLNGSGALEEDLYPYVSGSTGAWTFAATPSTTATLVVHAQDVPGTSSIFTYYPFTTSGQISTTADALTSGYLPSNSAQSVGAVGLEFEAAPTDADPAPGSNVDLSDQVVLRLSPVADSSGSTSSTGATTTPYPCS